MQRGVVFLSLSVMRARERTHDLRGQADRYRLDRALEAPAREGQP